MIGFLQSWECWAILTLAILASPLIYKELGGGTIYKKTIHIERYYDGVFEIWSDLTRNEIRCVEGITSVESGYDGTLLVAINKRYITSNVLRRIRKLAEKKKKRANQ